MIDSAYLDVPLPRASLQIETDATTVRRDELLGADSAYLHPDVSMDQWNEVSSCDAGQIAD